MDSPCGITAPNNKLLCDTPVWCIRVGGIDDQFLSHLLVVSRFLEANNLQHCFLPSPQHNDATHFITD